MNQILKKSLMIGIPAAIFCGGFVTLNVVSKQGSDNAACSEYFGSGYVFQNGVCKQDETDEYAVISDDVYDAIDIVYGNTANSPLPQVSSDTKAIIDNLQAKAESKQRQSITLISAASNIRTTTYEIKASNSPSATKYIEKLTKLNTVLGQAPTADGARYLEAINQAGRNLSNKDNAAIFVIGSGLSDGGYLNFASDDLLHKSVTSIQDDFNRITSSKLSATLQDKTIYWYGIGQTTAPQERLSDVEIVTLREIYQSILMSEGAKEVIFVDSISNDSEPVKTDKTVEPTSIRIAIHSEEVDFVAGTAEYKDANKAKTVLKNVANQIKNTKKKLYVDGYMAPENCTEITDLALKRAERVRETLIEYGVSPNSIEARNGGLYRPEEPVCDANGNWNEKIAQTKRIVIIHS